MLSLLKINRILGEEILGIFARNLADIESILHIIRRKKNEVDSFQKSAKTQFEVVGWMRI